MSTMMNSSTPAQTKDCIRYQEKLPLLAYGTHQRAEEDADFARHVASCAWCQEEIALLRRAQALLRKSFDELPTLERRIHLSDIIAACEPARADTPSTSSSRQRETASAPPASIAAFRRRSRHSAAEAMFGRTIVESSGVAGGCSLLRPDDPRTAHDPERSEAVASLLFDVYIALQRAASEQTALMDFLPRLEECLRVPMSEWQRMHVWYALALCKLAIGDPLGAQALLDLAADAAVRLEDLGACVECAYWLGIISGDLGQEQAAAEYFDIMMDALGTLVTEPDIATSFAPYYQLMIDALQLIAHRPGGDGSPASGSPGVRRAFRLPPASE
ncbi:MAG TPA: hypothetical protein VF116_02250 [Ktedonobacterales bacterium]